MQWTIGSVRITSIVEQDLDFLNDLIVAAEPAAIKGIPWLVPHFADREGRLSGLIQSFVIETADRKIIVDTCVGNDKDRPAVDAWHMAQTAFLDRFKEAGFDPSAVDTVLCTHMHLDHVGWNTFWDGTNWQPTFPNARYLFAESELSHWQASYDEFINAPEPPKGRMKRTDKNVYEDSIRPILERDLADIVSTNHQVCEEVTLCPTPGHTPGHVSIQISSQGQSAIITGDCVHHPCQIANPDWHTHADVDAERGAETRRKLFSTLDGSQTLLVGSHFSEPTAGRIEADGSGFRLVTE